MFASGSWRRLRLSISVAGPRPRGREPDREHRSAVIADGDLAAVVYHQSLDQRQADAQLPARRRPGGIAALEEPPRGRGRNTRAGVSHLQDDVPATLTDVQADLPLW